MHRGVKAIGDAIFRAVRRNNYAVVHCVLCVDVYNIAYMAALCEYSGQQRSRHTALCIVYCWRCVAAALLIVYCWRCVAAALLIVYCWRCL